MTQPLTPPPRRARLDRVGVVERLRIGEHDRVERMLAGLTKIGIRHLRAEISWADWQSEGAFRWFDWLMPRLAAEVEVVPCFTRPPPAADPADLLDAFVLSHGRHFEWVEVWPDGIAAQRLKELGKRTVLAAPCPTRPDWLRAAAERGLLATADAVGLQAFPGTWEQSWPGWSRFVEQARSALDEAGSKAELWISGTGYSTWRLDETAQIEAFLSAIEVPVERCYWDAWQDLDPDLAGPDGFHVDERRYHLGMVRADGTPKLLCHRLADGVDAVRATLKLRGGSPPRDARPVLITGGAGFVGSNLADRLASDGRSVLVFDNLSRPGVEENLAWLRARHGDRVSAVLGDVRDQYALREVVARAGQIYHLAAQVAVTTSVVDPAADFDVNLRGTFNLLEAIRRLDKPPPLVFASTNKVYGRLGELPLVEGAARYSPGDGDIAAHGIDERQPLDLHSPYGCSKGGADQYVLDYARIYGLRACVFRMSCLYGPRQFGTEDQGWVAHFVISALDGRSLTIYGDGKQVRDVLFVDDVVEAFMLAQEHIAALSGRAFNIGGGPGNAISLLDLLQMLAALDGRAPQVAFGPWRPGDQAWYVSDTRAFSAATGWTQKVSAEAGIKRLHDWLRQRLGDSFLEHQSRGVPV